MSQRYEGVTQLRTLFTIRLFYEQCGAYPTIDQLTDLRGLTRPAVHAHLKYLNEHGYIKKQGGSIRVMAKGWKA